MGAPTPDPPPPTQPAGVPNVSALLRDKRAEIMQMLVDCLSTGGPEAMSIKYDKIERVVFTEDERKALKKELDDAVKQSK